MEPTASEQANDVPLCVDLDGTLVNSDTLVESAVLLVKANPLYLLAMVVWLFSGKAHLKEQIAVRTRLAVDTLALQPAAAGLAARAGRVGPQAGAGHGRELSYRRGRQRLSAAVFRGRDRQHGHAQPRRGEEAGRTGNTVRVGRLRLCRQQP